MSEIKERRETMKAAIRSMLQAKSVVPASQPAAAASSVSLSQESVLDLSDGYLTCDEAAAYLGVSRNTVKTWMQNETVGVIRWGNTKTFDGVLRRYQSERYKRSAVLRLEQRLQGRN